MNIYNRSIVSVSDIQEKVVKEKSYWVVRVRLSDGTRKQWSLGPSAGKNRISKAEARRLREKRLDKAKYDPSVVSGRKALRLNEWMVIYLAGRKNELQHGTYRLHDLTTRYLIEYFGDTIRIDAITNRDARKWREALMSGHLHAAKIERKNVVHKNPSDETVASHVRNAKKIFNEAIVDKCILENPFNGLPAKAANRRKDWHFVDKAEFKQLLTGTDRMGWRVFLALQRYGGLRRQEAYDLRWCDVDLVEGELNVEGKKIKSTKGKSGHWREVPVNVELENLLRQAQIKASPNSEYVVDRNDVSPHNMPVRFKAMCKRAGIEYWRKPFQCLRKSRATDLAASGLVSLVEQARYLGHSTEVAQAYYIKTLDASFQRARAV